MINAVIKDIDKLLKSIETLKDSDIKALYPEIKCVCNKNLQDFYKVLDKLSEWARINSIYKFYYSISNKIINLIDWQKFSDDEIKDFSSKIFTSGIEFNLAIVLSNIYPEILTKDFIYWDVNLIRDKINKDREYGFCSQEQLDVLLEANSIAYDYYENTIPNTICNMKNLYKPIISTFVKFDILLMKENVITANKTHKFTKDTRILIKSNGRFETVKILQMIENQDNYIITIDCKNFDIFPDIYYEKTYDINYDFQLTIVSKFLIKDLAKIVEKYLY